MPDHRTTTHDAEHDPRNDDILIYVDGALKPRAEATVSVYDSGFLLGDGMWEGLRLHEGRWVFFDDHMDRLFSACKAGTLRDAGNPERADPKKIITKLHINGGHASATRIKRALVDAEGDRQALIQHVDEVVSQCETCQAFAEAPHLPIAGTSQVAMFNERLQMDLLFFDDIIALHIMDVFSKYSILTRVRPKNPQEVWDAFISSWVGVFGNPKSLHLDEGG